jgi:hypothetical protein
LVGWVWRHAGWLYFDGEPVTVSQLKSRHGNSRIYDADGNEIAILTVHRYQS